MNYYTLKFPCEISKCVCVFQVELQNRIRVSQADMDVTRMLSVVQVKRKISPASVLLDSAGMDAFVTVTLSLMFRVSL